MSLVVRSLVVASISLLSLAACSSSNDSGSGAAGSGGSAGSAAGGTSAGGSAGVSATGGSAGSIGGDTWDSWAKGFFATYCVECHGAGNAKRDYTTIDDVVRDQTEIRCGVSPDALSGCAPFPPPSQFPIDNATKSNPKPSDDERNKLVKWIDSGLP